MAAFLFSFSVIAGCVFALLTVTRRNPIYSALYLILFFGTVSLDFLLLDATFLAFMQLLVYAGAIMVLYLFVIMLINPREEQLPPEGGGSDRLFALVVALALFVLLSIAISNSESLRAFPGYDEMPPPPPTLLAGHGRDTRELAHGSLEAFGVELFRDHLLVFELTSFLILIAIVGSVHLSIRRRKAAPAPRVRKVNVIPEHARRGSTGPVRKAAHHA